MPFNWERHFIYYNETRGKANIVVVVHIVVVDVAVVEVRVISVVRIVIQIFLYKN